MRHVRLADGRSTVDLLDPTRVTLIGRSDLAVAPVDVRAIDPAYQERWETTYDADRAGAVLVRPDGIIAVRIRTLSDIDQHMRVDHARFPISAERN